METNDELDSFRRQWLEEVASRSKPSQETQQSNKPGEGESSKHDPPPLPQYTVSQQDEDDGGEPTTSGQPDFDGVTKNVQSMNIASPDVEDSAETLPKPTSALEHFEQAVHKEDQGILGDSLDLYRKAYRLDSKVDQTYRKKHFPPSTTTQVPRSNPSNAAVTVPNTAHHSPSAGDGPALSTAELIKSFSVLPIPVAEPIIANTPPPPCPISHVPSEVLAAILQQVALRDPASLVRVALVCKRMAYHVSHEQQIWRRLCQGAEFGFSAMHYSFPCDVHGHRIPTHGLKPRYTPFPLEFTRTLQIPKPFMSWKQVFQAFPRVRFTGIYVSTVNYTRPGTTGPLQNSWNTPIHIVTYYRYLRFYPDGTLISLCSTTKPVDVVPHISKENLDVVKDGHHHGHNHHHRVGSDTAASHQHQQQQGPSNPIPPTAATTLKNSLKGRWHIAKPLSATDPEPSDHQPTQSNQPAPDPRDIFIETEGVDSKYTYSMHLSLRSAGTPSTTTTSKNTKLAWKGYWCYNHLTDDWGEFMLRNDRAFVFRRVRGWGMS